jgi:hypothetical protein
VPAGERKYDTSGERFSGIREERCVIPTSQASFSGPLK